MVGAVLRLKLPEPLVVELEQVRLERRLPGHREVVQPRILDVAGAAAGSSRIWCEGREEEIGPRNDLLQGAQLFSTFRHRRVAVQRQVAHESGAKGREEERGCGVSKLRSDSPSAESAVTVSRFCIRGRERVVAFGVRSPPGLLRLISVSRARAFTRNL